jgi:hypothetical protein
MYLTHYGQLYDVAQRGHELRRRINAVVELAVAERAPVESRHERIKTAMRRYLLSELRDHGCSLPENTLLDIWETDLELNAQGWLDSAL